MVRPRSCVEVRAFACVVVKAWSSVEVSAPICAVLRRLTSVEVSVPTWVSVRLPIDVVVSPLSWVLDSSGSSIASRALADSALSCDVVRPCCWVVLSAVICVVEKLPSAVAVRPP